MHHSVLILGLQASLDPTITTRSIRLTMGMHGLIVQKLAEGRDKREVAFLDRASIVHATGLSHRSIPVAAVEARGRIGLIDRLWDGTKDELMADTEHGRAAGWDLGRPFVFPALAVDLPLHGMDLFLDPSSHIWSRNHRGFRTALVLAATYGVRPVEVSSSEVADLLQLPLPQAIKHLNALAKAHGVVKRGRGQWRTSVPTDMDPAHLRPPDGYFERYGQQQRDFLLYRQTPADIRHFKWRLGYGIPHEQTEREVSSPGSEDIQRDDLTGVGCASDLGGAGAEPEAVLPSPQGVVLPALMERGCVA